MAHKLASLSASSRSFLADRGLLRLGVAGVILLSLAYGLLRIAPTIERERSLLGDLSERKFQTIRLGSKLQYDIEESRRKSLRILVASSGNPEALQRGMVWLHENDATVLRTQGRIEKLGAESPDRQREFHQAWQRYVARRDQILAEAPARRPGSWTDAETDPASEAFWPLERSVQLAELEVEAESTSQIHRVSESLRQALNEFLLSTVVKIVILALLLWVDWRRVRTEKQLDWAKRNLSASERRFQQAYESAGVGMAMIALDGTLISVNPKTAQILGYERDELTGKKIDDFAVPESSGCPRQDFAALLAGERGSYHVESHFLRKDGSEAWVRNSVTLMRQEGQEPHIFAIGEEITQERQAIERLTYLANYDPVTNLPNRYCFEEELAQALEFASGGADRVGLLYAEIDSFDFLKGTFGRNVADEVLRELAASLMEFLEIGEVVGRLDDHVFGLLMRSAPSGEAAMERATQLREIFHRFGDSGKHRIPLPASIGIAYAEKPKAAFHPAASTSEDLLKFARAAMLEARARGGDAIFVAEPALKERAAQRHQIESALLRGLRRDEFHLVYQPQYQVATGRLVRFEALCRWNSSELGNIPPDRFIPIAEQTGLIAEIGRRVLQDSLRQARMWAESGRSIGVAVNISPMQFMRPDFIEIVTEILADSGFPPELLELEITEGIFIRDLNLAVSRIRELQRLGLSVALDDFGTGYSSLSYLQRMPIDAVKLDRSFVSELTTDEATVSMVRSVLAMAKALHLRVVTEGVETDAQMRILRSLGCDEAQGYLLGRPESAELALRRVLDSPLQPVGALV